MKRNTRITIGLIAFIALYIAVAFMQQAGVSFF